MKLNTNPNSNTNDPIYGFRLPPKETFIATKKNIDGTDIYRVSYSTDQYHRRTIQEASDSAVFSKTRHLILFGGSMVFGSGLNDQDTLHYHLSTHAPYHRIYNYAVYSYGPQQMLALLENNQLPSEIPETNGVAIYVFIPSHIYRLIGSSHTPWVYHFPYYHLDDNDNLVRSGTFWTHRKIKSQFFHMYSHIYANSGFLQLIQLQFPTRITDDHLNLMERVIERAKMLYEQQFHGTFYVLIHPLSEHTQTSQQLINNLRKKGITVIKTPIPDDEKYHIPVDTHPNGTLNTLLAEYLADYLHATH